MDQINEFIQRIAGSQSRTHLLEKAENLVITDPERILSSQNFALPLEINCQNFLPLLSIMTVISLSHAMRPGIKSAIFGWQYD